MDQHLQGQDQVGTSSSSVSNAADVMADKMVKPSGALAGLDPISQMSTVLASTILREDWQFEVGGEPIDAGKVADPECMLPMVLWEVERLHQTALAETGGVEFVTDPHARYGVRPLVAKWEQRCASLVVMALEPLHVALERYNGNLDFLVDQFQADYARGLIPWSATSPSTTIEFAGTPSPTSGSSDAQAPIP